MSMRWGLGPVFFYESLINARRWQGYAGRALFVLVLLVGMTSVWIERDQSSAAGVPGPATFQQMSKVGEGFFFALVGIQVSLVLLAAPAAAAGSICVDRARGTLLHLLVTDLSDNEIVLGKLGSRLVPVFGMIACGVPVSALAALLGGIEFGALIGAFVVSLALAVLGCVLAITLSVWVAKMQDVLMGAYAVLALWLLALPIWESLAFNGWVGTPPVWFALANPFVLVRSPYDKPGSVGVTEYALFVGIVLGLSLALLVLSILRLRDVVVGQSGRPDKAVRHLFPNLGKYLPTLIGPTLDGNPVLWREWHRNRPSRMIRRGWTILLVVTWCMASWGTYDLISRGSLGRPNGLPFALLFQIMFGLLMLSTTAPTVLADERVRGSLDVLLSTPLSTPSIVIAKWWGAYRLVLILAVMPLYAGGMMAATTAGYPFGLPRGAPKPAPVTTWDRFFAVTLCLADFLASSAMIVSIGVALATWIRRLGRAVVASVIVFFLTSVGWIVFVQFVYNQLVFSRVSDFHQKHPFVLTILMSFSPIAGTVAPLETIESYTTMRRTEAWVGLAIVVAIKLAIAGGLLWAAVSTFDRCMERMPESANTRQPRKDVILEELEPSVV
jgi:ABC-type Na+ efflux pump permease subunit